MNPTRSHMNTRSKVNVLCFNVRINHRHRLRSISLAGLVLVASCTTTNVRADESVARIWDEQLLHAISIDTARPTVHARNQWHLSMAMYDAWAAYDTTALQYLHHEKLSVPDVAAARNEAISYAGYDLLLHRFVTGPAGVGPGKAATLANIRQQMVDLGYDPDNATTVGDSPAARRQSHRPVGHSIWPRRRCQRGQRLCEPARPIHSRQ